MRLLMICAALTLPVSGCAMLTGDSMRTGGIETERAICEGIGFALPTRSRADTPQTRDEITSLYAAFAAACPEHEGLIP